jgi:hypothetical protein
LLFFDADRAESKTYFFIFLAEIDRFEYFDAAIHIYDSILDEF